jgi:hypothetical protein
MSAPLPLDRTDLNTMLKFVRAASRLRAVLCILFTRTAPRWLATDQKREPVRLLQCCQTLTLQRSKR